MKHLSSSNAFISLTTYIRIGTGKRTEYKPPPFPRPPENDVNIKTKVILLYYFKNTYS
jgi:hypothetical protein